MEMENDIKIVMTKQWTDVMTAYYLEASKHFQQFDPEIITVGIISDWTKGWLEANMQFTKMKREDSID